MECVRTNGIKSRISYLLKPYSILLTRSGQLTGKCTGHGNAKIHAFNKKRRIIFTIPYGDVRTVGGKRKLVFICVLS